MSNRASWMAFIALLLLGCGGGNKDSVQPPATPGPPDVPELPGASPCPDPATDPAATFYVCDCQSGAAAGCVAGDDSADGSRNTPFKTFTKAGEVFNSLPAGGTVAFCRGGAFDSPGGARLANQNCRVDAQCVMRDYSADWAASDAPLPSIRVASGKAFDVENGGNALPDGGYLFLNLAITGAGAATEAGFFFYNDVNDVEICGFAIENFRLGIQVARSNQAGPGSDAENNNIVLRNSSVTNCPSQGWLGACDGCGIAYSSFTNNGYATATLNHNIYLESHQGAVGMFVVGNELYQSAIVNGVCSGTSLVAHGAYTDLTIEGNTVREDVGAVIDGCWGIGIDVSYTEPDYFANLIIRRNTVINVGNVSIGTTSCQNCLIENNVVIQEQPAFGSTLIAIPNKQRSSEDPALSNVMVRNNTLYANTTAAITGIRLGEEGTGHSVTNNVIYAAGTGNLRCFDYSLADSAYTSRDHNVCFSAGGTVSWAGSQAPDLADWQSTTGHDAASLVTDPLFVSALDPYDFIPAEGSPLIDAAGMSPGDDRTGATRSGTADIGAYERP